MLLFKVIQLFLLPTAFVFLLFVLGIVFLKRKAGKPLIFSGLLLLYLFSITPSADLLLWPLESRFREPEDLKKADCIVLLTGGLRQENLPLSSCLSESSIYRTARAAEIYFQSGRNPLIIISGGSPTNSSRPALKMKNFLVSLGIPEKDILLEENSRNTLESARELGKTLDKPFFLVTSAYHMPRAVLAFEKSGLEPLPAAGDYRVQGKYDVFDFFPFPSNLGKCSLAFHEYFGIIYYKLITS